MTATELARQAIRAYPRHNFATKQQLRSLRVGDIKARRQLGDRYLLAVPVQRKEAV